MQRRLLAAFGLIAALLPQAGALAAPQGGQANTPASPSAAPAPGTPLAANGVVPVVATPTGSTLNPFDIHTLRDLTAACTLRNDNPYYVAATSLCTGYTEAVLDFHLLETMGPRQSKRKVCLPTPAPSKREVVTGLVAWAQTNPQYLDEPAASGVLRYFINTYPCHRKTFQWSPPGPMQ